MSLEHLGGATGDLADRLARAYAATGNVAAALIAGSVARGAADGWSDLELDVYWSEPPSGADRMRPIEVLGARLTAFWPYEPAEGEWSEEYLLDGVPTRCLVPARGLARS